MIRTTTITDEVNELFLFTPSYHPHCGPGVDSASNGNSYQKMFLGSTEQPVRKADNLTAIF
jgi:hypothetical protein